MQFHNFLPMYNQVSFFQGHKMEKNLAKLKIKTTLIYDTAIFAIMPRVSKVITATHAVMAHGGLQAMAGTYGMAVAAKYYSVPFMVLMPLYKLSPTYQGVLNQDGFNDKESCLKGVLNSSDALLLEHVEVHNSIYDYVSPEYITLLITSS